MMVMVAVMKFFPLLDVHPDGAEPSEVLRSQGLSCTSGCYVFEPLFLRAAHILFHSKSLACFLWIFGARGTFH